MRTIRKEVFVGANTIGIVPPFFVPTRAAFDRSALHYFGSRFVQSDLMRAKCEQNFTFG